MRVSILIECIELESLPPVPIRKLSESASSKTYNNKA